MHRFDDFTTDEIEIIEEALTAKVQQHIKWVGDGGYTPEMYVDRWRKTILLWEEISLVAYKARSDRFNF